MLKLLICLVCIFAMAVCTLQLRQQKLEYHYRANRLHSQLERSKAELWNQQLQIAILTAPNAIARTIELNSLGLTPRKPLPPGVADWSDVDIAASIPELPPTPTP